MVIIGREKEKALLKQYYESDSPEFLAVYGRRRIGKTYLIREFFEGNFTFYATGLANKAKCEQLRAWNDAINSSFKGQSEPASNWFDAFVLLRNKLEGLNTSNRKVIFIDEAPWMDTVRSGFLTALEFFWNGWASGRQDIFLIICGSSTSWIVNNLLKNRGGLYNRVTRRMRLLPFTLKETEEYLKENEFSIDRYRICEAYMIFGGIPYYLSLLSRGMSIPRNVDALCFSEDAILKGEFSEIYSSLFKNPDIYIQIVIALAKKGIGLTRDEIIKETKVTSGGLLTKVLTELELCGFIRSYPNYLLNSNVCVFQLIDPFTLFFIHFIYDRNIRNPRFWTSNLDSPSISAWKGYAFEMVCLSHAEQIKQGLGISAISTETSSWKSRTSKPGAQIDLVIDRKDGIINLCEFKYSKGEYAISDTEEMALRKKIVAFERETKTKKAVRLTMVTTFGIENNKYSGVVQSEVILKDLFS